MDLNVAAAWAQGVTGKNVTTAIMDDGVDYMHPDIIHNYVSRVIFSTFTQPHKKEKPYFAIKCFNDHPFSRKCRIISENCLFYYRTHVLAMTLVATIPILILDTQTIGSTGIFFSKIKKKDEKMYIFFRISAMEHAALVKYLELEITEFVVRVLHTIPWLLVSNPIR